MIIDDIVGWGVDRGVGDEVFRCVDAGLNISNVESNLWVNWYSICEG